MLVRAKSIQYGLFGCCKCKDSLSGTINFVGKHTQFTGNRMFCNKCWSQVEPLRNEEIYAQFEESPIYETPLQDLEDCYTELADGFVIDNKGGL